LGVPGAALALVIARAVECLSIVSYTYISKSPVAATMKDFLRVDFRFIGKVLVPVLPIIANEFLWSMGITTYYVIYARMGTESIAAMNIVSTIDQLALVVLFGLTSATSVIVGNQIGAGNLDRAYVYGGRSLGLGAVIGVLIGILVVVISPLILSLYQVSPEVIELAQKTLIVASCFIWLRSMNAINIVGNLRAGGDTTYSLVLDGLIIWILGVPMAYFAAFVLGLPVYLVYLFSMSEELVKWLLGLGRYFSRRWIHNLTARVL
jgi:Na+-driven multidrug efflux pump